MYSHNKGNPQIFNENLLNITGVDYTVAAGEFIRPCIYQFGRSYALVCNASGEPAPQLTWYYYKDLKETIIVNNRTNEFVQYYVGSSTSIVVISNLTLNNSGLYYCNATNDIGFEVLTVEAFMACMYAQCVVYLSYCYNNDNNNK